MEKKKKVSTYDPLLIKGLTLIPVVEVSLNCWNKGKGISISGTNQPIAIVVISPSDKKVIRITGEELSLDQFTQEVPDIKETLEKV